MKQWIIGVILGAMMLSAQAREIKKVNLLETVTVEHVPLVLNGAGVRTKLLFDVYVIGLYTPQKMQQPEAIVQLNKPRRVSMTMLRKVEAHNMYASLLEGLKHNVNSDEISSFQAQLAQMEALFKRSGALKKGDVVLLDFIPARGMKINVRNGQYTAEIGSEAFARSVLKIWLGQKPADKKLKYQLAAGAEA